MAGTRFVSTIDLTGPFFKNDPAKTFRENARSMMRAIAVEGQTDVIAQMLPGQRSRAPISAGVTPARVSGHISAGVPFTKGDSKTGQIIANVYVGNEGYSDKQGQALMAAYSRVEGETHAFRRTTGRLRRARAINVDELLQGIK